MPSILSSLAVRSGLVPRRWPRSLLMGMVRAYRLMLSPWLGNACRFEPTCSRYALEALERHGALAGSALAAARILRCQPWCAGGCDPVPQQRPRLFSSLLPAATQAAGATDDGPAAAHAPQHSSRTLP